MELKKVMLIGHLGDDVKIHFFDGGGCVGFLLLMKFIQIKLQVKK